MPEYPYNIFPSDILRRVIGALPAPKTQEEIDENLAHRQESILAVRDDEFKGELGWGMEPYPQAFTLGQLVERLNEDAHSYIVDVAGPRNYTEDEIRNALAWHIEQGYVVQDDGGYCMTRDGLAALTE